MKIVLWLIHEIKELSGRALYFMICFSLILLILKLILDRYDIDIIIWPKILLGSFIASKATFVVDQTSVTKNNLNRARYINILSKTFFYTLMSIYVILMESFLKSLVHTKNILTALDTAFTENFNNQTLAVAIFLFAIFLNYNIFNEIDSYLGGKKLKKFFFSNPRKENI
ncbi:MAG: hypothetical protein WCO81_02265 [Cyanobacteriota bacterium ELA615]